MADDDYTRGDRSARNAQRGGRTVRANASSHAAREAARNKRLQQAAGSRASQARQSAQTQRAAGATRQMSNAHVQQPVPHVDAQRQGGFVPSGPSVGQFGRNSGAYRSGTGRGAKGGSGRGRTVGLIILAIVLIAAIIGAGLFIYKEMRKSAINTDLRGDKTEEEMEAIDAVLTGTQTFDEPFIVLLLGSDMREDDPDMGARTDTNILCRIDPTTNTISLISIQRDTLITIDGVGQTKFNAAYTWGGTAGTIQAVKNLTGVDIDHYAEINFEGLVDLIDAVGGVDVEVEEEIDDPDAGGYIPAGLQHLDGQHALIFARSRAYADGDYTRTTNQRKLIMALAHKLLETPAADLQGLIQASTKFLTTDPAMDFDFLYSVADQIRHNNDYPVTIYSANLPSAPAMIGDVSYVIADEAGVQDMIRIFLEGGNIEEAALTSSLETDMANAGANSGGYTYDPNYSYSYDYETDTYSYDTTTTYDDGTGTYVDPNAGYTDPNAGYVDPNAGYTDPNAGYVDPGYVDPNAGAADTGYVDPNAGAVDPNAAAVDAGAATEDAA